MARQTRTSAQEMPSPMAAFVAGNGEGIETAMESQRAVMDGMAEISQEVMTFMSHRLQEDMEASKSLMACKTPEEAFHVQRRFAETATREYFKRRARSWKWPPGLRATAGPRSNAGPPRRCATPPRPTEAGRCRRDRTGFGPPCKAPSFYNPARSETGARGPLGMPRRRNKARSAPAAAHAHGRRDKRMPKCPS